MLSGRCTVTVCPLAIRIFGRQIAHFYTDYEETYMNLDKTGWKLTILGVLILFLLGITALVGVARPPDKAGPASVLPAQEGEYAGGDMCFVCHDIEEAFQKNPHYNQWEDESLPWSERGCETCHGPGQAHIDDGGDVEQIFRFAEAAPQEAADKCLDCHLTLTPRESNFLRNEHGLNSVACTECHSIHKPPASDPLLKARQPALCYDCHNEVRAQFNKPFRHKIHEGLLVCSDCHEQHGGNTYRQGFWPSQLNSATGNEIACYDCHPDKQGPFVFEHLAVRVEGCVACHEPHGSTNPRQLKRPRVATLCLECHSGTPGVHGPEEPSFHRITDAERQSCTLCHVEIHGSNVHEAFFE
jgi:DmsE family decaheme c-type cytochrome